MSNSNARRTRYARVSVGMTVDGHVSAFLLKYPGRNPTVMKWTESGGSGGSSSWITLELAAHPEGPSGSAATDPDMYDQNLCKG